MKAKTFFIFSGVVFLIVAMGHFLRVVIGFDLIIAGWSVPIWVNVIAFLIAGSLAYLGFRLR